jgi:hypothetical protein
MECPFKTPVSLNQDMQLVDAGGAVLVPNFTWPKMNLALQVHAKRIAEYLVKAINAQSNGNFTMEKSPIASTVTFNLHCELRDKASKVAIPSITWSTDIAHQRRQMLVGTYIEQVLNEHLEKRGTTQRWSVHAK